MSDLIDSLGRDSQVGAFAQGKFYQMLEYHSVRKDYFGNSFQPVYISTQ